MTYARNTYWKSGIYNRGVLVGIHRNRLNSLVLYFIRVFFDCNFSRRAELTNAYRDPPS